MSENELKYEVNSRAEEDFEVDIDSESDIDLEVVDDTPEEDRNRRPLDKEIEDPTDEEIEQYGDKVKGRIKELTHARHDERRAKEAAQREKEEALKFAQYVIDENKRLREFVNTGQETYTETLKKQAETELDMARRKFKEAQESYDSDEMLAAQEALAEAKMRMEQLKGYKPTPLQEVEYPVYSEQTAAQPPTLDERTLRWQQKNQWFGSPGYEELTSFALGLHQKLVNQGVDPKRTPDEYYERIDARMREVFPTVFGETAKPVQQAKKPATVVAPVGRTGSGKRVQLTKTQVALAKKFGLSPKQYAEAYLKTMEN
jgi:predicted nucleotidyltransferase